MNLTTIGLGLDIATKLLKQDYLPKGISSSLTNFANYRNTKHKMVYRLGNGELEIFLAIMSKLAKNQFTNNLPSKSYVRNSRDRISFADSTFDYRLMIRNNTDLYSLIDFENSMYIYYRGISIYIYRKVFNNSELYFVKCYGIGVNEIMPKIMKYVEDAHAKRMDGIAIRVMLSDGKIISNQVSFTPFKNLITEKDVKSKLQDLAKRYTNSYYGAKLTTYGVLLSGPSGSGKTTIAKALAYECDLSIVTIPSEVLLSKDFSLASISSMKMAVILIEEIDRIFVDPDDETVDAEFKYKCESAIATLMQLLDGTLTPRNSIFILTTNYPELINRPELVRESRIDERLIVNYFSKDMATEYLVSQNIPEEDIPQLLEESKLTDTEKEMYHVENESEYVYPPSKISLNVNKYKRL